MQIRVEGLPFADIHLNLSVMTAGFFHFPLLYSGKLLREKIFVNFTVLWLFAKVFSAKFGGSGTFGAAKTSNSQKFS